jgi:hypothetical protein
MNILTNTRNTKENSSAPWMERITLTLIFYHYFEIMKTREMIEILEEAISYLKTEEPKTGKLLNIISPVWNFCFSIRQKTQMKKE